MQVMGEFELESRYLQFERSPLALVESNRKEHIDVVFRSVRGTGRWIAVAGFVNVEEVHSVDRAKGDAREILP